MILFYIAVVKVAGVLICKVHHSFTHMFGTLAEVAGNGVPSPAWWVRVVVLHMA